MKGHLLNLGLAMVFSVLIWSAIGTHLIEQTEATIDFRIEVPQDVIATYAGQPSTGSVLLLRQQVKVTLQGPKEEIDRLNQLALEGVLILSEEQLTAAFEQSPPHIILDPRPGVKTAEKLVVVSAQPSQLRLELERVEDQMVWVEPGELVGEPAPGYRVGEVTVTPRRVAVRGPASLLSSSYKTLPVDLGGANKPFPVDRPLACPAGVVAAADTLIRVQVDILPELTDKTLELPVQITHPRPETSDESTEPLPYKIKVREGWSVKIKLRGPKQVLQDLEDDIDRSRLRPIDAVLPVAYVPAGELPRGPLNQPDRDQNLRVEVVGLPPDVEVVEPPVLPVTLVRVVK